MKAPMAKKSTACQRCDSYSNRGRIT